MAGASSSNTLITPTMITRQAMVELKNALVLVNLCDRQHENTINGNKIGGTIKIRKRVQYQAVDGPDITGKFQDTTEGSISLTLNNHKVVPLDFSKTDLSLSIEDFSERYLRPAMIELAQQVDSAVAQEYYKFFQTVGVPGSGPSTFKALATGKAIMDEMGVPMGDRSAVVTPAAMIDLADGLKAVYVQPKAQMALERASVGIYADFQLVQSNSIVRHTTGTYTTGSTPLVNGASQNVAYSTVKDSYQQSLITDGWAINTAVIKKGDTFTIAGVYSVNPRTRVSTGRLQSFTALADGTSDGSGNLTLTISPHIIVAASNVGHPTVNAAPANDAAITMTSGTEATQFAQHLLLHKEAITVGFANLEPLDEGAVSAVESYDGITISYSKQANILTHKVVHRMDILFGLEVQNPWLGVRLYGDLA